MYVNGVAELLEARLNNEVADDCALALLYVPVVSLWTLRVCLTVMTKS